LTRSLLGPSKKLTRYRWSIVDQALVSGSNFLLIVILARELGPLDFGRFVMFWALLLFLQGLQLSLISQPMLSLAPAASLEDYGKKAFGQQMLLVCVFLGTTALAGGGLLQVELYDRAEYFGGMFVLVAFLFQDFSRKEFLLYEDFFNCSVDDFIRVVLQIVGLAGLYLSNSFTLANTLIVFGLAYITGFFYWVRCRSPGLDISGGYYLFWKQREYTRWLLYSSVAQWFSGNIYYFGAGVYLGVTAVGALRAAQNMIGILHVPFQALENILPRVLVRTKEAEGTAGVVGLMIRVAKNGFIGCSAACLLVFVFAEELMLFVYSTEYASQFELLRWFCVIYPVLFLSILYRLFFRAVEHTKPIFYSYVIMDIIGIAVIVFIALEQSISALMVGMFLSYFAGTTFMHIQTRGRN
jgi:O-antigen/teichoic acid export membrane protein